ncbi:hypothetical protein LY78DRAFT_257472 [Colletotrichum sublineola]|nr:hypothetical protein LY78DRAFT_257472 [Colletotrichum sublineola]
MPGVVWSGPVPTLVMVTARMAGPGRALTCACVRMLILWSLSCCCGGGSACLGFQVDWAWGLAHLSPFSPLPLNSLMHSLSLCPKEVVPRRLRFPQRWAKVTLTGPRSQTVWPVMAVWWWAGDSRSPRARCGQGPWSTPSAEWRQTGGHDCFQPLSEGNWALLRWSLPPSGRDASGGADHVAISSCCREMMPHNWQLLFFSLLFEGANLPFCCCCSRIGSSTYKSPLHLPQRCESGTESSRGLPYPGQ